MTDDKHGLPPVSDEQKEELYIYSLKRMAEHNLNENLTYMTQLYNLRAFHYKSGENMRNNPDKKFALLVLDLANFKSLNEFCGRDTGDSMLIYIADILRGYMSQSDLVVTCHFRADNFALLTPFNETSELEAIAQDITAKIAAFRIPFKVLPAIGICVASSPDMPPSIMRDYATMALQTIKGKFYATYAFFDESMRKQMLMEKLIENDILEALNTKQLQTYIQPKVDMKTGKIIGGEALVRWNHPDLGLIAPARFIPVLEKNGLVIDVDTYIWTQVFDWLGERLEDQKPVVPISINISRVHCYDTPFKEKLVQLSDEYHVPPSLVPLELTESSFQNNSDGMFASLKYLKEQGFTLSMDDFGTGYSTMTMLKDQPVDEIKIDKGFIDEIADEKEQVIVSNIVQMLKSLNKSIIIEGVETEEQKEFMLKQDCVHAQGFLYYKPMPIREFEHLLDQSSADTEKQNTK